MALYEKTLDVVAAQTSPYFIGLQTISSHTPYATPYGNTADVLIRLKGCPSTVRRYPITLTPCCQFRIGYQNIDCDRNQLYVYQADVCSQWDVAICKYNSGAYTELRRKRMRFNGLSRPMTTTICVSIRSDRTKFYVLIIVDLYPSRLD